MSSFVITAIRSSAIAVLVAVALIWSIVYYPYFSWGKRTTPTDHQVDRTDTLFIVLNVLPFAVAVLVHHVCSPNFNEAYTPARSPPQLTQSKLTRWVKAAWIPRWRAPVVQGGSWSIGDFAILVTLIVCNGFWWFLPSLARILTAAKPDYSARSLIKAFARGAAYPALWDAALAITFVVRENYVAKSVLGHEGSEYHRLIRFHIGLGYSVFLFSTFHSLTYLVGYAVDGTTFNSLTPWVSFNAYHNFWGLVGWLGLTLMVVTSIYKIRRKSYVVFYWTHQLYALFLLGIFMHKPAATWYPFLGPILYFVHDRVSARLRLRRNATATFSLVGSGDIMRIEIHADATPTLGYAPGDRVSILVPSISRWNWHPFSISTYFPEDGKGIVLFAKARGAWTARLKGSIQTHHNVESQATAVYSIGAETLAPPRKVELPIKLDGPFGSGTKSYLRHTHLVAIGAGTGIAALFSFVRHYHAVHPADSNHTVHLVWVTRHLTDVAAYPEFVRFLAENKHQIRLHLYLTKEEPQPAEIESVAELKALDPPSSSITVPRAQLSPIAHHTVPDTRSRIAKIILALVVFGTGTLFLCLGRILQFSYSAESCSKPTAYVGANHFLCIYWYPLAPITLSTLTAALAGVIAASVLRDSIAKAPASTSTALELNAAHPSTTELALSKSQPKPSLEVPEIVDLDSTVNQLNATLQLVRTLPFVGGHRPDVPAILKSVAEQNREHHNGATEAGDVVPTVGVLAAGPESIVRHAEGACVDASHELTFYRASWKI
ncbi:hypothetical protein BJ742DRAFT_133279 [Cladochytrium replicatum]|nr:hypothetical protein BJ742DRAFT_133279 [Cladochytrium replicatum]